MRSNILTLSLIAGMTLGGAAFAGTTATTTAATTTAAAAAPGTATGTITKINAKGLYVVLSDGWRYHVTDAAALKDLKVGEKVKVTFEMKGKHHNATAITAG